MAPKVNLVFDQGADFSTTLNITDDDDVGIDITGWTFEGKARKEYTSTVFVTLGVAIANATLGSVTLSASRVVTGAMVPLRYVYDVEAIDTSNNLHRIIEGQIQLNPQATK